MSYRTLHNATVLPSLPYGVSRHDQQATEIQQALQMRGMQFVAPSSLATTDYVAELHALRYEADMAAQFHACNL